MPWIGEIPGLRNCGGVDGKVNLFSAGQKGWFANEWMAGGEGLRRGVG